MVPNRLIAQHFADALVSCFQDEKIIKQVYDQNEKLMNLLVANEQLINYFQDLKVLRQEKLTCLSDLLSLDEYDHFYCNTLKLFIENGHSNFLLLLLSRIEMTFLKVLKTKAVEVYSAFALLDQQKVQLEALWNQKLNTKLVFHYHIVPEMVLGIKVRVGDIVEEYSMNSHLSGLKKQLDQHNY